MGKVGFEHRSAPREADAFTNRPSMWPGEHEAVIPCHDYLNMCAVVLNLQKTQHTLHTFLAWAPDRLPPNTVKSCNTQYTQHDIHAHRSVPNYPRVHLK